MTLQELRDDIWRSLPPVRKRLVGRRCIEELITTAIECSPIQFADCIQIGSPEEEVFLAAWRSDVKKAYCLKQGGDFQFGPLFWIVAGPILQFIITRLLNWWFESSSHRVIMAGISKEAHK